MERRQGADYIRKMMHRIPDAPVVDRVKYILDRCKGKRVLNLGCASGALHQQIKEVAPYAIGADKHEPADLMRDFDAFDKDDVFSTRGTAYGSTPAIEIVIAGEILEHLSNPGNLLSALKNMTIQCPILITTPNAFSEPSVRWSRQGYEQVNADHVAWYSYWTLKALVERYGFRIREWAWYGGKPITAEGLIFLVE